MYGALKGLLFKMDPERAHHLALRFLKAAQATHTLGALRPPAPSPRLASRFLGFDVAAPLGMAAGFDKGAEVHSALFALGFGHVEVGTVTPKPQPGNDGLRVQRHPQHQALVNRMGFPGPGMEVAARRLAARPAAGLLGGNIGPNKTTPAERVVDDLRAVAASLAPHVRFLTINVSSPNTPGLRALQAPEAVSLLVRATLNAAADAGHKRPVLLKLHPDAADEELVRVARAAVDAGAAAIIATNTTRARPAGTESAIEGGLSGAPLLARSRQVIAALHHGLGRDTPLMGVGGILTGADALGHIRAGATLVQSYTGFIYRGPRQPRLVHDELVAELDKAGLDRLDEAMGQPARSA
ncbi:MAG: quinone-dependent dihydroorotate dehydrogenase [Candidatus Thermoplasmatota archaeon]